MVGKLFYQKCFVRYS